MLNPSKSKILFSVEILPTVHFFMASYKVDDSPAEYHIGVERDTYIDIIKNDKTVDYSMDNLTDTPLYFGCDLAVELMSDEAERSSIVKEAINTSNIVRHFGLVMLPSVVIEHLSDKMIDAFDREQSEIVYGEKFYKLTPAGASAH